MGIIDSHMHINSELDNKDEILCINNSPSIESVINVGMDTTTSRDVIEIANKNKKFYAAVGIHPLRVENSRVNSIFELATSNKVVAIGEIGLDCGKDDYGGDVSRKRKLLEKQKEVFIKQILIANELKLPVIIHSNNTNKIVLDIFEKVRPEYGCVFHCSQPNLEDLERILSYKYYISFAGRITYTTAERSIEVAKCVPNDRFLIETDSPFISPEPYRDKPGKTEYIKYVIEKLAEVRETTPEEIIKTTEENTKRLFKKIK